MKTKKLFLMAAMLLMSVCMFAQNSNTPLKGDVNGDGKVDVADIVAILKIMKDAGVTQYTVTYHSNGGNSTPASQTVNAGETVTLAGAISRNADSSYTYEFSHWNTNSSDTGTSYNAGQTITINNNIDLYAQWDKTAMSVEQYTVTFDANGGNSTPSPITVDKNTTITLPAAITRDVDESYTYSFKKWNTHRDGSGSDYNAGQSYTVTTNVTLYATWNKTEITPVTPTTEYYWYVGQTQPTVDNYTSLANQVNGYTSPIEYTNTSGVRERSYILIHNSKSIASIIGKVSGGNISFYEDTSINIPNYKVYKTAAIATNSTIIITIQ